MDNSKEIFYDKEKKFFLYLMIYVSRFFMTDEEIVVFDLFIHNECLYLEKDIISSINMNEHKIRSILSKLLKEKFIIEIQKNRNNEKGSTYHSYYCLNNYIVYVIDYRIKQMENQIQKKKNESDVYVCNYCNSTYSQLDAQTLPLDSYDAHFLCFCNNKIELIENDDNNEEIIYDKYTKYLNILKEYTEKLKNYFIPLYTEKFNRNNINACKLFLADNFSEESITNNSSEVSLTNNSSLLSQVVHHNEHMGNGNIKKDESYTDTCSSIIRKNKKIKICMNVKTKPSLRKSITEDKAKISNTIHDTKDDNVININKIHNKTENNDSNDKSNKNTKKSIDQSVKDSELPLFFIQKFNKKFALIDAQKLQQDMTQEEFENFMDLQDAYLDQF